MDNNHDNSSLTTDIVRAIERIISSGKKAEIERGRDGVKFTEINRRVVKYVSHP